MCLLSEMAMKRGNLNSSFPEVWLSSLCVTFPFMVIFFTLHGCSYDITRWLSHAAIPTTLPFKSTYLSSDKVSPAVRMNWIRFSVGKVTTALPSRRRHTRNGFAVSEALATTPPFWLSTSLNVQSTSRTLVVDTTAMSWTKILRSSKETTFMSSCRLKQPGVSTC